MLYEVKGIGFPNRGAALMLAAVQSEIRRIDPAARFCVAPETPYAERCRFGLLQKIDFAYKGRSFGRLGHVVPRKVREMFGLVSEREIDVILDASGYAYGDPWGAQKARKRLADDIARYKRTGKAVILLPQAFGPFSDEPLREAMRTVVRYADLLFARDAASYDYLVGLDPAFETDSRIRRAPDFTNLLTPSLTTAPPPGDWALIPNHKMTAMKAVSSEAVYTAFMAQLAREIETRGGRPFLLVHEGEKDRALAMEIAKAGRDHPLPLREETDAKEIKALIGACRGVVSSRFHGLVSALSQGVPVIATGWSHKYKALLADYGMGNFLLPADAPSSVCLQTVETLMDEAAYSRIRDGAADAAIREKEKSEAMWRATAAVLRSREAR